MSQGAAFINYQLNHYFCGDSIPALSDDAGTGAAIDIYVSLHTADPSTGDSQDTNECAYTSYARVAVPRTSSDWLVVGNQVRPAADIVFPTASGGAGEAEIATYISYGIEASGPGMIMYSGPISSPIDISNGVPPTITTDTVLTVT